MRAYTADMIPGGASPVINVSQYDNDYAVTVTLIEGAEIYTPPSGATIMVEGTKPDSNGFSYACTYQGNVVTVPIYTQMTAVAGRFPIELVVYQSGLRVGSCNITLAVERAPLDNDEIISDSDIPAIIALAQAQADAAASSAASAETAKTAAMDAAQDAIDAAQELQTAIQFNAALIHETASGAVASFADGADNIPMQSVVAEITPVQSGSGDPSPTNIRPISGRTGMTVRATGKNLLPLPYSGGSSQTTSGITFSVDTDGKVAVSGTSTGNTGFNLAANLINAAGLKEGQTVYISAGTAYNENAYCRLLYADNSSGIGRITRENYELTITADMVRRGIVFQIWVTSGHTISDTYAPTVSFAQMDGYEKYNGQTYPISWQTEAGTVYGGTLNVITGVLTVDSYYMELAASDVYKFSSNDVLYFATPNRPTDTGYNATPIGLYCNRLPSVTRYETRSDVWGICYDTGVNRLQFRLQGITTQEDARAWVEANPLQIVYKLATPQTYQLTPTEVRTLLGGNTIYTDAGSVTVEYIADTKLYIDGKIAELQALVLEN